MNLAKACSDIFEIEARLAAERGDQAATLGSMLVLQGLANHLDQIETPSLHATFAILIRLDAQENLFSNILPALPAGSCDVAAWEKAMNLNPQPPAGIGELLKGVWDIGIQSLICRYFPKPKIRACHLTRMHLSTFITKFHGKQSTLAKVWISRI